MRLLSKPSRQKLFKFEVDQSNRIEFLTGASVVTVANSEASFSIAFTAHAKRQLHLMFRRLGIIKQFGPKVFAGLIVLAVKHLSDDGVKVIELIIDREYEGHERRIISLLKQQFPKISMDFASIGKRSPAHIRGYRVYIKKQKADATASAGQVLSIIKR